MKIMYMYDSFMAYEYFMYLNNINHRNVFLLKFVHEHHPKSHSPYRKVFKHFFFSFIQFQLAVQSKSNNLKIKKFKSLYKHFSSSTTNKTVVESWSPQKHSYPEKIFPSNVLISLEAEKNPLSLIENPHKSPFRKFFYDHSKVELFSFLCSNFYKKILSTTRHCDTRKRHANYAFGHLW